MGGIGNILVSHNSSCCDFIIMQLRSKTLEAPKWD